MGVISKQRRSFLRKFLFSLVALPASLAGLKSIRPGVALAEATDLAPLDEDHPTAKVLGYKHDVSDVDIVKFPRRAGEEGAKQFCDNCSLYTKDGLKVEGSDKVWGKCAIFPNNVVAAKGWCNSWAPKPS
jgi:hypothetical protein